MMKALGASFLFTFMFLNVFAQNVVDEKAVISFKKGLEFHAPDTAFGVNIRFRMQNRLGFETASEDDLSIEKIEARVKRLRLRLDGYIKNYNLTYYIQLSFTKSDLDWDDTECPNIIQDAMVFYHINKNFYLGFGQGKLPGNRERIVSSGSLQFVDRSILNATFNIDRDFGLFAYYTNNITNDVYYKLKLSTTSGEGRNVSSTDNGIAYTGRFEFLPLGLFTKDGDFIEGDLEREAKPKVSLAFSYSYNDRAKRSGGQKGCELFEARSISTAFSDILFKYQGWALMAEFSQRQTEKSPLTFNSDSSSVYYVYNGLGFNSQISYLFKNKLEIAGRYAYVKPEEKIQIYEPQTEVFTLGATKYINKHRTKLQLNLHYQKKTGLTSFVKDQNNLILQFQVELGI